jgi:hypothetical protein
MILRNPLFQGHITEHPALLLDVSSHDSLLSQTPVEKK